MDSIAPSIGSYCKIGSLIALVLMAIPSSTRAAVKSITTPAGVRGDANGDAAGWMSDGQADLEIDFDCSGTIPPSATINSVIVQITGTSISPSHRNQINLRITAPGGQSEQWDSAGAPGFPNSPGRFDTGSIATSFAGGPAAGVFTLRITDDLNNPGDDARIDSVSLTVDYSPSNPEAIGAYLNGNFPAREPETGDPQLPTLLSETGAFSDLANLAPVAGLKPFVVNSPLWSDGASKLRWIAVPSDGVRDTPAEQIVFSADSPWSFPVGTVAVKHFQLATNAASPGDLRRLETRFLIITDNGFYGVTYRWRPDGSDADLISGSITDSIAVTDADGSTRTQHWTYPGRTDCRTCHNAPSGTLLGLRTYQLNRDLTYPGESAPSNQLLEWQDTGAFTTPVGNVGLLHRGVDVGDTDATLEHRVHSYLATNCSNCHYPGNMSNGFDLRFETPLSGSGIIDGLPLYDLGITDGRVIAPGDAARSLMHFRASSTAPLFRMPPIGSNLSDPVALQTLTDWIGTLSPAVTNNNAPAANDDEGQSPAGTPTSIGAFGNDFDADGDAFSLSQDTQPANGSTSWDGAGTVTYIPDPNFIGTDSFTYSIVDAGGRVSTPATVTVTVRPATTASGISFSDRSSLLPGPSNASGVAMGIADMNQDGFDDVVHLDNASALYIDHQQPGGANFTRLSLGAPSTTRVWGMALGDTDNNGMPDIVTGGYYDGLQYFRADSTGTAYTKTTLNTPAVFLQATNLADINGDGWLDIFACHDDSESAKWRNSGTGTMIADTAIIDTSTIPTSDNSGNYGSVWTDYDGDGDTDLYIAKCRSSATSPTDPRRVNQLFRNDGAAGYTEVAAAAGLADGAQSWVADFADIDNDGDLDCFIGNHSAPSRLMRNNGDATFTDVTSGSGISVRWRVIQSVFRDFNNDGWTDLLLAGAEHGLWLNDRDGTFTRAENPFSTTPIESCAIGDLNHDGFPDVYAGYATLYNSPDKTRPDKMFLSNPNSNGFIALSLLGRASNRLASGASLELHGPWGTQLRDVRSGEGYGVTHSFSQRFGLGNAARADKLVVRWPSGTVDTAFDISANQFLELEEGSTAPPSIQRPVDQDSEVNSSVSLQITASDPTSDPLIYSAVNLPTGLSIDPNSGLITGTTANATGNFPVSVAATDGWSSHRVSFSWAISQADLDPPTVALTTSFATVETAFTVSITFSEPVSDLAISDLSISNGTAGDLSGNSANYTLTVTPTSFGEVRVQLPAGSVTDRHSNTNDASNSLAVTYRDPSPPSNDEYTLGANTVALYHFNRNLLDASPNALHFDTNENISFTYENLDWMVTPTGSAIRFSRGGDSLAVSIPDSLLLAGDDPRPLTIEARIYPRAWLGYGADDYQIVSLTQDGETRFGLEDSSWRTSPQGPRILSGGAPIATADQWAAKAPPGRWSHLKFILEPTGTVSAWVNGQPTGSVALDLNVGNTDDWVFTLGNFDGDIDEIWIHRGRVTEPVIPLATPPSTALVAEALRVNAGELLPGDLVDDADTDGFSNLFETAFGASPLDGSETSDSSLSYDSAGYTLVSYPVPAHGKATSSGYQSTAFDYTVETSNNLFDWIPATVSTIETGAVSDGFKSVTQRIDLPPSRKRFFVRVEVGAR